MDVKPFPTKPAAHLVKDDLVKIAEGDWRYVLFTAFTDEPIDSNGTTGVRIWWRDRDTTTVVAAVEVMTLAQPLYDR
jgi:hypothetical protein